jgi:hypothetical protein
MTKRSGLHSRRSLVFDNWRCNPEWILTCSMVSSDFVNSVPRMGPLAPRPIPNLESMDYTSSGLIRHHSRIRCGVVASFMLRPVCLPRKEPLISIWIWGRLGATAGLNAVEKRKIHCRELNPGHPVRRSLLSLPSWPGSKYCHVSGVRVANKAGFRICWSDMLDLYANGYSSSQSLSDTLSSSSDWTLHGKYSDFQLNCQLSLSLMLDRRSVGRSVLEWSNHLGLTTRTLLPSDSCDFF